MDRKGAERDNSNGNWFLVAGIIVCVRSLQCICSRACRLAQYEPLHTHAHCRVRIRSGVQVGIIHIR